MKSCLVTVRNESFEVKDRAGMDTNDVNIAHILGADKHFWYGERDLDKFKPYELIMFTMPKIKGPYENEWMELIRLIRQKYAGTKFLCLYQEAECDWVLGRPLEDQLRFFKVLEEIDLFMAHNEVDKHFFEGIAPKDTKVIVAPTPLPLTKIFSKVKSHEDKRNKPLEIIFGSSFDGRSNGLFGYSVGMRLKDKFGDKIKLTQYTRAVWHDDRTQKIREALKVPFDVIPTMSWPNWIERLSEAYISMNLMPAAAAGRDAIVFSALGIPHIGTHRLDILRRSMISVDVLDCNDAFNACNELIEDKEFYDRVREEAITEVKNYDINAVTIKLRAEFKHYLGVDK